MNSVSKTDKKFMMQALKLASCGLYTSYPNPPVGCVIVRDGKLIGKGYHHKAGQPHAEIMALKDANYDVEGATAYVTLEPCSHYGRTPPCALKLVEMKVARVVVAAGDPNPQVCGKGFEILRNAGIEVVEHVLEKKSLFLNRAFFKSITGDYPYVSVKVGMSLDAKTALSNGQSKWITNEKCRAKVQDIRAKSDCIITGVNTVIADNPQMNVRYENFSRKKLAKIDKEFIRQPLKVILDTKGILDLNKYQIFSSGNVLWVNGTDSKDKYFAEEKINEHVTRLLVPLKDGHTDIDSVLRYLGTLKIRRVMVEAGEKLTSAFINQNFCDEIYAFVSGKMLGSDGQSAFSIENALNLDSCRQFYLHKCKKLGSDALLHFTSVQY
ncbi:bifunctional diaminohydroxyphosphoribosylaminopyrimidine deaminase/5-amino-6-(5-phosphoribosylamino)uracil reductase RibD [Succinivibrio dextrinosolvens]|uniref:bifunctional diaminohydroxyphosphoribosylaminopyrimidine deaminase/5-amino-6-(5-phosphoribosylamino)uracil reductase RibD n=1 Tax=Succinivibrio dextrinosolvens TaxID=83771 RepID=UPI0019207C0D|nr:bifunctional diaminohydroxyphosphoribosylaminopyrimidine deaminase/5-amino-6-(5-phosphoribosylamino)uracil reductase RibD [Succinivibrio dextrinosolvens]